jgi:hypothetical protein
VEPLKEGSPAVASYNRKRKIKPIQEIKKIFFHNDYRERLKEAYFDVAIVQLKQAVKLNKFVHPVCLPVNPVVQKPGEETERSVQSQRAIVTGYITDYGETTGKLHKIEPKIKTQHYCNETFSDRPIDKEVIHDTIPRKFDSTLFCAKVETGLGASCRGDSGAPIFRYEVFNRNLTDLRYVQIGTLHGSVNNCENTFPGIYSRIEDPSIFEFVESFGQVNGRNVYSAPKVGKEKTLIELFYFSII